MLGSKHMPREMSLRRQINTFPENKQGEQGGNNTLLVPPANRWSRWYEVYSYIRPQKVFVVLNPVAGMTPAFIKGEMKFIDESGTIKTITVPGKASFYLDLGRTGGPARKEVLARFSSSWVPIYRGAMNGIRERVVISKISNL